MIGFEVELDRRVADASGKKIAGDRKLASCAAGEFKVVTDLRSATRVDNKNRETDYSNIELVTKPFDQTAGLDAIAAAVKDMRAFTAACYAITNAASIGQVLQASGLQHELTAEGVSAAVHPAADLIVKSRRNYRVTDLGADSLFVHYTAGYPVGKLYDALEWITGKTRDDAEDDDERCYPKTNAKRAARAGTAAAELFVRWAGAQGITVTPADAWALRGYVALVYTQLAACIDHADPESEGQIKNKTVAVSRVPLRAVARALPDIVQRFLWQQAWVDMLNDYEVGPNDLDLTTFIGEQVDAAQEAVDDRSVEGPDAGKMITQLDGQILKVQQRLAGIYTKLSTLTSATGTRAKTLGKQRLTALQSLGKMEDDLERQKDIRSDYLSAVQARDEWNQLKANLPAELRDLNSVRIARKFPWSVINHAIVPALEGRPLAGDLTAVSPDALFQPVPPAPDGRGPDGAWNRELATDLTSDLGGAEVTVGEYLRSALLTPCQRPIWQTMIFGGMHELDGPDVFKASDGRTCALIPLELRSYGPSEVTWDQLGAGISEIAAHSMELLNAAFL
jgi:hypothetical protein